jgi:hypothetical protein
MRISPIFAALALSAVSVGAANAQLAVPITHKAATGTSGISLAYDAPHGQFTAGGVALKPAAKSNVTGPTTGTINVSVTIKLVSKFPKNATIGCSVIAIGGILDLDNGTVDGGIETVTGEIKQSAATPGSAVCTVAIPYSWDLPADSGADSGLVLAYAAAAVDDHGKTLRTTLQLSGIENLPANGTASSFAFDAAL